MARLTVIDTGIWQKTGNDTISRNTYFGILGGTLTWGCVLSFSLLQLTADIHFNLFEMIGYGIILPLFGIFISVNPPLNLYKHNSLRAVITLAYRKLYELKKGYFVKVALITRKDKLNEYFS